MQYPIRETTQRDQTERPLREATQNTRESTREYTKGTLEGTLERKLKRELAITLERTLVKHTFIGRMPFFS